MDSLIQKLKKQGLIFLWEYKENSRNYPGWNISFDKPGFTFLNQLIDLMYNSQWPSKKSIQVNPPTESILNSVNNLGGKARWRTPQKLTILYKKQSSDLDLWELTLNRNELVISIGANKLKEFKKAISEVHQGKGDFAISDSKFNNILYFWVH